MKTFSNTVPIGKLFENSRFTIPEIQRDYAWDAKKEVSKLLEDMWKYFKVTDHKTSPQYFIGTIIVYSEGNQDDAKQIMDGQQRITSLTSLMAAIKSHIEKEANASNKKRKTELEDLAEQIEDKFLFDVVNNRPIPKLQPKSQDTIDTIKQMIQMDGHSPESSFEDHPSSITKGKLYLALKWFYHRVYKLAHEANPDDPVSEIIDFYNLITEKIVVTLTTTTTIGMAFQMFVSVNGAGKPLNAFDLLRGLLVAKSHALGIDTEVSKEIRFLSKDMKMIEKTGSGDGNVKTCMLNWTEVRNGKNIQENDIAGQLEKEIREFTEYTEFEEMIRELRNFIIAAHFLNTNRILKVPGFMQHRRVMGMSGKNSSWKAQHMLIYTALWCSGRSHKEIDAVMDAVEWVSIRGGWSQIANVLENIYPVYANKILYEENVNDWFDDFISSLTEVLNKADINGFSHLEKDPISESKATVLLHKVRGSYKDPGPGKALNNCNACPCMPEGAPSPWNCPPERQQPKSISGLLGNWFLMKDIQDKEIGKFQVVPSGRIKQMLENANTGIEVSNLEQIQRKISNGDSWKTSDIRARRDELLNLVEQHWPKEFVRPKF